MQIVHQRDFQESNLLHAVDEPYFRLIHPLTYIHTSGQGLYTCRTATESDLPLIVHLINLSYEDLSVSLEQMQQYMHTEVYAADLWIIAYDSASSVPVGCGIADFDNAAKEGILEWIQVLPQHRGKKAGQFIVNELLRRLGGRAKFATVSGKVHSATKPEALYRKCGFTGNDVWHILRRNK